MSTRDEVATLLESIQPASDAVFDALDSAAPKLKKAFGSKGPLESIGGIRSTQTHVTRALLFSELAALAEGEMGAWTLTKSAAPNCPVWLSNGVHSIRVLHTWSSEVVPPTGRNPSRVSYYSNSLLGDDPECLFENHNFLLLWEQVGDEFTLRLVHTLGAVRLNRHAQLDLDLYLERGMSFADMMFEQRDEGLDYFDREAEDEEGEANA